MIERRVDLCENLLSPFLKDIYDVQLVSSFTLHEKQHSRPFNFQEMQVRMKHKKKEKQNQ